MRTCEGAKDRVQEQKSHTNRGTHCMIRERKERNESIQFYRQTDNLMAHGLEWLLVSCMELRAHKKERGEIGPNDCLPPPQGKVQGLYISSRQVIYATRSKWEV